MVSFEASGKYRLDARLGGGGMAEVFVASALGAEGFSRRVAIKRVLPGFSDNPAFAQMFVEEARISSRLVHPNIVSVLDFDRDLERRLFLVMELVEGKDLDTLLQTGTLPVPVVIYAIAEVLRGLGHAHDLPVGTDIRGIVHRDVSPHNVLLSWEGAVKVSDFGIAKARAASDATASQFIKGKPSYMSPEQANGEPLDGRSDLFAVGIMLWEMLVGRRLFVGDDTRATLAAVLFSAIPRPRSLRVELPKDVDRVAMKLLERDLPARYPTAEAALRDLLACQDAPTDGREVLTACLSERFPGLAPRRYSEMRRGGGRAAIVAAVSPSVSSDAPTLAAGAGASMAPTAVRTRAPRRSVRIAFAVAAMVVGAGMGVAAVSAMRRGDADASSPGASSPSASSPSAAAPAAPRTTVPASSPIAAQADAGAVAAADPASAAALLDAAPADAPHPAPPGDAAIAPATPPHVAQKDAPPAAPAHAGYGTLNVTSSPIAAVTIDGTSYGDTPALNIRLSAGPHRVVLENTDAHYLKRVPVTITANQVNNLDLTH